jgi:acetyl coenzyme A synthetase (ADP forming)-like protein
MLKKFFYPKSVAVIGASHKPGKIGHEIFKNFLEFPGKVFPINPNTEPILGKKVYPSVLKVKDKIDLAIIVVPAPIVGKVLRQCVKKKIKAVIIISAGFSEIGEEGRKREEKLKKIVKGKKVRIIGPNVIGVYCPKTKVDTLFLSKERLKRPKHGNVAIISQSGAVGSTILDSMAEIGVGISKFVSYGNAADVNEVDLLKYLKKDKDTKVIAVYIEGIKSKGDEFVKVLKEVGKKKPIIILKAGKTEKGRKAVISHTGSLAGSYEVYSAVFKQAKIIEAENWEDLFDLCKLLSMQPLPKGNKVLIVTNGGGFGILATDEAEKLGLNLKEPSEKMKKKLKKVFPPHVIISNPLDLAGDTTAERYEIALREGFKEYDAIICITLFQVPTLEEKIVEVLSKMKKRKKTLICCAAGSEYTHELAKRMEENDIPVYPTPERAIRVLAKVLRF